MGKKYTNNEYREMLYKEIAQKRKENSRRGQGNVAK